MITEKQVKSYVDSYFVPEKRLLLGVGMGLAVAVGLALAYTHGPGMSLLENGEYRVIDSYAFMIALLVGSIVPLTYWVYFRDVSEALAIFGTVVWALFSGFEDLLVYAFLPDHSVPQVLPWLDDGSVGFLAGLLGFEQVTKVALYSVVAVSFVLLLFFVKILEGLEREVLGFNV